MTDIRRENGLKSQGTVAKTVTCSCRGRIVTRHFCRNCRCLGRIIEHGVEGVLVEQRGVGTVFAGNGTNGVREIRM